MSETWTAEQLEELYDNNSPQNRTWFYYVVNDYVEVTKALNLSSLPWSEGRLLEVLLIDLVESWIDREGIGPETEPYAHQTDDLRRLIIRCAKYFMGNPYLESHLVSLKQSPWKAHDEWSVDFRGTGTADFTVQPRFPRLRWFAIPRNQVPILYECFCGAQSEGFIHFLRSERLEAPYIKYLELLNLLKAKASFSARKLVLNNVDEQTKLLSRKRNVEREQMFAEVTLFSQVIERPSLIFFAISKGYWSYLFFRFRRVAWRLVPLFAASLCASLDFLGGAVLFGLWFLRQALVHRDAELNRLDRTLIIYNDYMNNLYQRGESPSFMPRSPFELKRIVEQLVDAGEALPLDVELLLRDLEGTQLSENFHYEDIGSPFDGEALRLSLLRKLSGASNLADTLRVIYPGFIRRDDL